MRNRKMQKKKAVIATIVALTIFVSMFSAVSLTSKAISDASSTYTYVNGNLNTDTYTQYPFEANNVSFGFSQYGELLGIAPGANQSVQGNWVGMSYNGLDVFAPKTSAIPMPQWINGWYLYISYIDVHVANKDRNLWAFAMFSDGNTAGGPWQVNVTGTPDGTPYGGRKTNGYVVTDPLQVLYNGPREYIAQSTNHIFDNDGTHTWPVVDLIITMIFDKVSKQVVLYKDLKTTIEKLDLWGKLNVQLSDREEYDMGSLYAGYAHFYEQAGVTCYTPSYSTVQSLTRDYIDTQAGSSYVQRFTNGTEMYLLNPPSYLGIPYAVYPDYLKVYIDGVFVDPSAAQQPYSVQATGGSTYVLIASPPSNSSMITFKYKYIFKSACPPGLVGVAVSGVMPWWKQYDYAQLISSDNNYVAWDAFWPPTSSYTVDGVLKFTQPLYDYQVAQLTSAPKRSPLIIGQWDVALDPATLWMFRAVEVKGICNLHNAQDPQEPSAPYKGTTLDVEAQYQLNSVFNPYDLKSAINNNLRTWVDYYTVTASDITAGYLNVQLSNYPVHYVGPSVGSWETYNSQSERVFVNSVLQYPTRSVAANEPTSAPTYHKAAYTFVPLPYGMALISFPSTSKLHAGDVIKVIYATDVYYDQLPLTFISLPQTTPPTPQNSTNYIYTLDFGSSSSYWLASPPFAWEDNLDVTHNVTINNFAMSLTIANTSNTLVGNTTWTYTGTMDWKADNFTVYKEDTTQLGISSNNFAATVEPGNGTTTNNNMTISLTNLKLRWSITGPDDGTYFTDLSDVRFSGWNFNVNYAVNVTYFINSITNYTTVAVSLSFTPSVGNYLFKEEIPGAYEWGIVGTHAASVDSAGLSMISAAMKDKRIEYGTAGEDIQDTAIANQIPSIFSQMTTNNITAWSPYYYGTNDLRVGLKDDWDPAVYEGTALPVVGGTHTQIAGANLVGSGGLYANMLAYYGNDFVSAFYGTPSFTPYAGWSDKIVALSCWNDNYGQPTLKAYSDASNGSIGYAVVSTFEDLNGTTGLLVWGIQGKDTYYAAQWFYMNLIEEFQTFPCGATSIILQINYNTAGKPCCFTVVEVLGTISETGIVNEYNTTPYVWAPNTVPLKGGIHPDP